MNKNKKRILLVDDEVSFARLLKLNLEQTREYEVRVENSSNLAWRAAHAFLPDLIVLDLLMPGKDGAHLASDFRSSPKFKDVPVVFLTAAVSKEELEQRHGMFGGLPCLAKPVETQEVLTCLKQQLRS